MFYPEFLAVTVGGIVMAWWVECGWKCLSWREQELEQVLELVICPVMGNMEIFSQPHYDIILVLLNKHVFKLDYFVN